MAEARAQSQADARPRVNYLRVSETNGLGQRSLYAEQRIELYGGIGVKTHRFGAGVLFERYLDILHFRMGCMGYGACWEISKLVFGYGTFSLRTKKGFNSISIAGCNRSLAKMLCKAHLIES